MIVTRPLTNAELDEVRHLVNRRAAIVLDVHKNYLIESRLTQLARSRGFGGGAADVVAALKSGVRGIDDAVVEAMTTHETSFFRDRVPFELLRDVALPRLLEKRAVHHHLNIWSAASSLVKRPSASRS